MATSATVRGASALAQRAAVARVEQAIRSAVRPPRSRYLAEFAEAFREFEGRLTEAEVVARAASADIVLVGDYHSLAACQKFMTALLGRLGGRANVLGLEAVYSAAQPILDEWWRNGMDEDSLRSQLRFARDWGYEWSPYGKLLAVARRECQGVWGLDSEPRFDLRRVRVRDRHMAERILEMRRTHPEARAVVFVGESHLAPEHLPLLLREAGERVFTILQNVDALYWQVVEGGGSYPAPVSLDEGVACVFNASPLEKYESYQDYLDRW